jgi:hypothetical protein
MFRSVIPFLVLALGITILAGGCAPQQAPDTPKKDEAKTSTPADNTETKCEGWWCNEHGVPEEVCTRCQPKLVAQFKKDGDWCSKHDRPDSQCFICHPELKAKFAALYEEKEGKKPPEPDDE